MPFRQFIRSIISLLLTLGSIFSLQYCNKDSQILFLGKCFCEAGWEGESCDKPILKNGDCECPEDRLWLKNFSRGSDEHVHKQGYRCEALCRWNKEVGCPRTVKDEWEWNQVGKQLRFYNNDLPRKRRNTDMRGRLDEFAEAYQNFYAINHTDLGEVIEFGCGGFTQFRHILEYVSVTVKSVTLVDPLIDKYMKIPGCSYASGSVLGYPTKLHNFTVEEYGKSSFASHQYDTVIDMNVLLYAKDAFQFLTTLYKSVKLGGYLIFHERWFDNPAQSSKCKTAGFGINVVQVAKPLLDHFLSFFSTEPYFNTNQTKNQVMRSRDWCRGLDDERSYWIIVRKVKEIAV